MARLAYNAGMTTLLIGGTGLAVFGLDRSPMWFVFAFIMLALVWEFEK